MSTMSPLMKIASGSIMRGIVLLALKVGRGLLVPPRTYTIDLGVEDERAGLGATAGDFDMRATDKVLNRSVPNEAVVEHWQAKAADRRTILFCTTVEHADAVADAFRTAGVTAGLSYGGNWVTRVEKAAYRGGC